MDRKKADTHDQPGSSMASESAASGSTRPPDEQTALLQARVRQQAAVADLGRLALSQADLDTLMDEAIRLLVETLDIEFAKVLELQPDGDRLLLRAGIGWHDGIVGRATVSTNLDSQAGYTLHVDKPVIVEDLRTETRFSGPSLLFEHGVVSGMSLVIRSRERPFGVLGVHSRHQRTFTTDDVYFLRSIANVLAMTIERARIDLELHERHQAFQALGENAPDIIARFDRDFRHVYVNRAIEQYVGIPASEFIGKSNSDLGLHENARQWEPALREVFETSQERWIEFSFRGPEGQNWFQGRLAPEFDRNGEVSTVLAVVRDISVQQAAIEQLRESEERFRTLSTSSPVGIVVSDVNGRLTYINPRCEEITGVPVNKVLGSRWISLVHDDDREQFLEACRRSLPLGQDAESEIRIRGSRNHDTWVLLRASPMHDDGGRVSGYVATLQDITERKVVEHRLRFLAEAGGIITQSLDVEQTVEAIADFAVPEFADYCLVQIFNSDGELSDVTISHFDPDTGPPIVEEYRNHIPQYREPHPIARVHRTRMPELIPSMDERDWERFASDDEHLHLIETFRPRSVMVLPMIARDQMLGTIAFFYSDSGRKYSDVDIELASDLADRAALAIDNARLYQEAQKAIRSREEFLSIASHELKTPLTSVKGYAQLLELAATSETINPERILNAATRVSEQVRRFEALINDLLDVSRIQQGKLGLRLERVDLADLVRSVVTRFDEASEIAPSHTVNVLAPEPVTGFWDPERLDQVLTNLLSNALKYSPEGGEVTIEVKHDTSSAMLIVSDEGIGIPPEEQSDLFQPFKRTRNSLGDISGTGLGLFIVRQIVDQHSGTIDVQSREGEGSRFTVRLPLEPVRPSRIPEHGTRIPTSPVEGENA